MKSNIRSIGSSLARIGVAAAILRSLAVLAQAQSGICTPAPAGLVTWWPGNGQAMDVRSQNHGTMVGGAYYGPGMNGEAFDLDGDGDYVSVPSPVGFPLGGSPRTMMAWIQTPSAWGDNYQVVMQYGGNATGSKFGLYIPPYFNHSPSFWGEGSDFSGSTPLELNTWYHVALTYDGGTVRIYLNGQLDAAMAKALDTQYNAGGFTLGRTSPYDNITSQWNGMIDEAAVYDRALSGAEIQAIYLSGAAGLCSPTAVKSPLGMTGWWSGDGYANDVSGGGHNAVHQSGLFTIGKVGQAFNFNGIGYYAEVSQGSFDPGSAEFSLDFWMRSRDHGTNTYLVGKSNPNGGQGFDVRLWNDRVWLVGVNGWDFNLGSDASVTPYAWHHVVVSSTTTTVELYVDGVLKGTCARSYITPTANPLRFGNDTDFGGSSFSGQIDEVALYNRAINADEVRSLYQAGLAGKLKTSVIAGLGKRLGRPEIPPINQAKVGDATITFTTLLSSGIAQEIPLSPNGLPDYPSGYYSTGLAYDVATSAGYSGTPMVCFNLPSLAPIFSSLRVLHLENGDWVDRTQLLSGSPNLCTSGLPSLSPFAIATLIPTVAPATVSGRVLNPLAYGISNARVSLTDQFDRTVTVTTGSFGYYRFDTVAVGETYVLTVSAKRYTFNPQSVTVMGDLTDLDLTAESVVRSSIPLLR